jgi:16S rRNA (uracil1498-N3)-methyltransferase
MQIFYAEKIENEVCALTPEESRHCISVLRYRDGDRINVFSRNGEVHTAQIIKDSPKECILKILDTKLVYRRPEFLHVAISPTKNTDRLEWFIEKAVEIGVEEITPIYCDYSKHKPLKVDRIERVVVSSMKQSLNLSFPKINPPAEFKDVLNLNISVKCIATCEEKTMSFTENIVSGKSMLILIGPESDFSRSEITMAMEHNFIPVTLGRNRLRTETAGVVSCTIFRCMTEKL